MLFFDNLYVNNQKERNHASRVSEQKEKHGKHKKRGRNVAFKWSFLHRSSMQLLAWGWLGN